MVVLSNPHNGSLALFLRLATWRFRSRDVAKVVWGAAGCDFATSRVASATSCATWERGRPGGRRRRGPAQCRHVAKEPAATWRCRKVALRCRPGRMVATRGPSGDIATSLSHFAMSLYDMWGSRWCDIATSHDTATVSPTTCH